MSPADQPDVATTRVVAFDLDDTLAESKATMAPEMVQALQDLLAVVPVCIISGGRMEQFEGQVLAHLDRPELFDRLHLMPTCGTRYYRWQDDAWTQVYAHDLTAEEKADAVAALEDGAATLGLWSDADEVWGDRIEDRGSQITLSALGQEAPVAAKKAWDPSGEKREKLRAFVSERLPSLEVRSGGSTSIDITARGIDKAFGIDKLCGILSITPDQVHFVGDRLEPGGNDYPVLSLGVSAFAVEGPEETLAHVRAFVAAAQA
ncbi:HAD-IIB family hydrolase [Solicola sp. PLA-1-18]|uniref:HAD-IIB family hydrolase n=1 Tax=Solicola sp. PLA-1-18 TaxID=3380532 RepID=UPI003B7CFE00